VGGGRGAYRNSNDFMMTDVDVGKGRLREIGRNARDYALNRRVDSISQATDGRTRPLSRRPL